MKRFITICIVLLAAVPAAATPARILSWDAGSVTVEIVIPPPVVAAAGTEDGMATSEITIDGFPVRAVEGEPRLPMRRFIFEVPGLAGIGMQILAEDRSALPGIRPSVHHAGDAPADARAAIERASAAFGGGFARLAGTGTHRGRHLAFVDVYPAVYDPAIPGILVASRLVVRLTFPPPAAGAIGSGGTRAPLDCAVNAAQAAAWRGDVPRRAPAADESFAFSRSSSWIKIRIREQGVYAILYGDLLAAGVSPSQVDPATVRIFSTPPFPEPEEISAGGSFTPGYDLSEHPILLRGGTAGEFTPADTVIFYAVGSDGWSNEVEPSKAADLYRKHPYATENVYWMTWGGAFDGPPKRMAARTVAPAGAPGTISVTTYEERLRRERDEIYDAIYSDDRWFWRLLKSGATASFSDTFTCTDLAGAAGVVRAMTCGPYIDSQHLPSTAYFRLNGANIGSSTWIKLPGYNPGAWAQFQRSVTNLVEGRNIIQIYKAVDDEFYTQWHEIFYERQLKARGGTLRFFAPDTAATARFDLTGFTSAGIFLFDVTRYDSAVVLSGATYASAILSFEDELDRSPRQYVAVTRSSLRRPALSPGAVTSLRDDAACPDMVIVYHDRFRDAALALRDLHARGIPGIANPVVRAARIDDIYANFSGGRKDALAVRNYFKYLYDRSACAEGGEPSLRYALLIGNGTYDPRDNIGKGNDFVPYFMHIWWEGSIEASEDEDYLVAMDAAVEDVSDIAIGRMPVLTAHEADGWADRISSYRDDPEPGAWRDRIVLVADDVHKGGSSVFTEKGHMALTESLASRDGSVPRFYDINKVYLQDYPFDGATKPAAKKALLREWSDGALILEFVGHGSALQMADEQVMVISDIYSLTNGRRRPLFLAFSCAVGDLESPYQRSMAQNMVTYEGGGAIATICAAAPTYMIPNEYLNIAIFQELFTSKDSTGTRPIGSALQRAKLYIGGNNSSKYHLLGDPALMLAGPQQLCDFEAAVLDTMSTGRRYRLDGAVRAGGAIDASFSGSAEIVVQEAEYRHEYAGTESGTPFAFRWIIPGRDFFRGNVDVVSGRFGTEFTVPRICHVGENARVRIYAEAGVRSAAGAADTLLLLQDASVPQNTGPPDIAMYFAGNATKVKAGARLIAELSDPDGIALLGTSPQNSIFLEFDGSGYPVYVTDYFEYDHGSSTAGRVEYPLQAEFEPGRHRVYIRAFDNLGASKADTLDFEVVEEGLFEVTDIFAFPNPFAEVTNIVYQLTSAARVTARIFTLSGVEIWKREDAGSEGFNTVVWDGRDAAGDRVANGTYLFTIEVDFRESSHRAETVKGKVVLLR